MVGVGMPLACAKTCTCPRMASTSSGRPASTSCNMEDLPGKRPLGPLGIIEKFDVAVTLLPSAPSSAAKAWFIGE